MRTVRRTVNGKDVSAGQGKLYKAFHTLQRVDLFRAEREIGAHLVIVFRETVSWFDNKSNSNSG